jgi:hypothetical protein
MCVTRARKHFGDHHPTFLDKDGQENHHEMKKIQNNNMYPVRKKILEMGLQAGRKMLNYQSQTYFNRQVNKAIQYEPADFLQKEEVKKEVEQEGQYFQEDQGPSITDKLNKFIDKVAPQIEEALQSNELINVFQDDF